MSLDDGARSNVVAAWRDRDASLARQGWACAACGRVSLARRRICTACGAPARAERAPLPRRGQVAAISLAGAVVEHLDQVTGRKPAVLVDLGGGARIACLVAHADSLTLFGSLRGQPVRLAIRRIPLALGPSQPIPYGVKAALDIETRSSIKPKPKDEE